MLTQNQDGTLLFNGTIPMDGYKHTAFFCVLPPFQQNSIFSNVTDDGPLFIEGKETANGSCLVRSINIPFLMLKTRDGIIKFDDGVTSLWFYTDNDKVNQYVPTSFSSMPNLQDDIKFDINAFLDYDQYLGSEAGTFYRQFNDWEVFETNMTIEGIGKIQYNLTRTQKYENRGHPFSDSFGFEDEHVEIVFHKRNIYAEYLTGSFGFIRFKNPNDWDSIVFGTNFYEWHYQGKKYDPQATTEPVGHFTTIETIETDEPEEFPTTTAAIEMEEEEEYFETTPLAMHTDRSLLPLTNRPPPLPQVDHTTEEATAGATIGTVINLILLTTAMIM